MAAILPQPQFVNGPTHGKVWVSWLQQDGVKSPRHTSLIVHLLGQIMFIAVTDR